MRAFLFTFLLIFHISVLAQKHTISGYVSDFETGESVIGANIFSNDYSAGVSSNKYGFYSITLDEGFMLFHLSSLVTKQSLKNLI